MTLSAIAIREAAEADLPAIVALRHEVGWHAFEWALRDAMRPPHGHFLVADDAGRVVGCGSAVDYGPLGVIGNMVVTASQRRRGLGAEILRRLLAFLRERGCRTVELYATAAGRPLYEGHRFRVVSAGMLMTVPASALGAASPGGIQNGDARHLPELAAYDAPRFGGDRSRLLGAALTDPLRPVLVARNGGAVRGYAVIRPDGVRLGPWVADTPDDAATILSGAFQLTGSETLTTNIASDNRPGVAWLSGIASEVQRHDGRMRLGPPAARRAETLYGTTVGALG